MINQFFSRYKINTRSVSLAVMLLSLSGCQLVQIQEHKIDDTIKVRSQHIVNSHKYSIDTTSLLKILSYTSNACLEQFDACIKHISAQDVISPSERYSALSELYLAQALSLDNKASQQQIEKAASAYDLSLKYSYAYLFKSGSNPNQQTFDLRQMQVRTFYNYALSRLMRLQFQSNPTQHALHDFSVGQQKYRIDSTHYLELQKLNIQSLQSSYVLNFSGFDKVNRQDGLGAEFIVARQNEAKIPNEFILDPITHYADQPNPRIHHPHYLSVTATVQPEQQVATADEIISGQIPFNIHLYNPYQHSTATLDGQEYSLTANYTAPFAYWLAQNQLGKSAFLSLLDRVESLRMPHLYMLEPYQPNKKIVVLVHGLASSPETWMNLTNNILGDVTLRDNYQVWMASYSTNMPIVESRFQIHALLKQAFAQTQPLSASSQDAVLIGHSMGGIISRLLVSDQDISKQAIPLMNYEQFSRLQQNPIIGERFQFKSDLPFSRAVFVAAPHRGSDLTDRWYVEWAKKLVKLPTSFFDQVNIQLTGSKSTEGLVQNGPDDLSPSSHFMQLTNQVMPKADFPYHSIVGNAKNTQVLSEMSDGIVPYASSHLDQAQSEKVFKGGHSIHAKPETILELRRILHEHLNAKP